MGRIVDVVIYCANSKNRYKAFFEEKQSGKWYGVSTEKLPPLSFFERWSLKSEAKKRGKTSSLSKFGAVSSMSKSSGMANVHGSFFSGSQACPFCGNTGFVKCGVCSEWTCSPKNAPQFKCAVCGNSGKVSGKIESASGNLSQNNNNKKFL